MTSSLLIAGKTLAASASANYRFWAHLVSADEPGTNDFGDSTRMDDAVFSNMDSPDPNAEFLGMDILTYKDAEVTITADGTSCQSELCFLYLCEQVP